MKSDFNIIQKDRLKYLYIPLIKGLIIDIIIVIILSLYYKGDFVLFFKLFAGIFIFQMIFYNIPLLVFFNNHFKKGRSTKLTIEDNGEKFIYQNKETKILFTEEDIQKVIFHLSPSLYDKRPSWLYWDDYFYSEIITKNQSIKISCLVINNLEEYIKEDKVERRKAYFPLIKS